MNYRIVHDEWFLDREITKLDTEIFSFLLVKLAKKHSYLKKIKQKDKMFFNQIETSVAEILIKTSLEGDEKRKRRLVRDSLRKLEKKNFLVLNSQIGKNHTLPTLPFLVEVLWSTNECCFVPRETKNVPRETKNGGKKKLNVSKNDTFNPAECVEKRHIRDMNVSKNDTLNAECVEKRHIHFQDKGKNKAKIAKSASLIDIIGNNMENFGDKLQKEYTSSNEDSFAGLSPTSYFSTEGIRGVDYHAALLGELNQETISRYQVSLKKILISSENISNLIAPELRSPSLFRFSTPLQDENQLYYTTHDKVGLHDEYLKNDLCDGVESSFLYYLRDYPRGIHWAKDSGAPWAGPKIPFFYFESSKEYLAQPGFSRNSPFPRMADIISLKQVMSYDTMVPHPYKENSKVPLYKLYPGPARMMFWLMATTGLPADAVREEYKYYLSQVTNPSTYWGKYYKRNTPKIGHDWLINFRDFLLGCAFTNRFSYFHKNVENKFMLKFPNDEIWESQPFFGSIIWHNDRNQKRQEVYLTTYQNDYHNAQEMLKNKDVHKLSENELDKVA